MTPVTDHALGVAALAVAGLAGSVLLELLVRTRRDAAETRQTMLESMIRNSPAAMALFGGPEFTIRMCNPAYQALAPGEPIAGRTVAEVWPEAAIRTRALLRQVRVSGEAHHATGYPVNLRRDPGGAPERRYFDFSFVPLPVVPGETQIPVLAVVVEVTQHKEAQESLERANAELSAIYHSAPATLLVVDDQVRVEKSNLPEGSGGELPCEVLGCVKGCGAGALGQCVIRDAIVDTSRHGTPHTNLEGAIPVERGGERQEMTLLVSTARLRFGGSSKVLVCAQDITRLKSSQRQLEAALAEKTVLLQEVHHRVKNNLAVVSSLLGMKLDASANPEVREALEESRQRVHSMAVIHEFVYASDRLDRVEFSEYARQLVQGFESSHISFELDLPPVELTIERAVPCALILNELLTNAFKYAFPGGRRGRIRVSFQEDAGGRQQLTVEDDGIGFAPAAGGHSLGLQIVHILASQLDARLEQVPGPGTRFVLTLPSAG